VPDPMQRNRMFGLGNVIEHDRGIIGPGEDIGFDLCQGSSRRGSVSLVVECVNDVSLLREPIGERIVVTRRGRHGRDQNDGTADSIGIGRCMPCGVERLSVLSGDFVIMAFSAHGCPLRSVTIAIAGSLEVFADGCGLCRWSRRAIVVDEVASALLGGDLEELDQQAVGPCGHGEPSSGHRGDVGDITTACPESVDQCVQIVDEKADVVEQVPIMSGGVLRFEEMDSPGADPEEDVAITIDGVVEDHLGAEMCGEEFTESSDVGGDEVYVVEIDPDIRAAALAVGTGIHRDSPSGRAGPVAELSTAAFIRMSITTTASALRSSNCSPSAAFSTARPRTAVQNPRVMAPGVAPTCQPVLMKVSTMADSPAR